MHHLAAIVGQLCGFVWGDDRYQTRGGYFAWVGSENAIDFFPYLEFGRIQTGREDCGQKVCVSPSDLTK